MHPAQLLGPWQGTGPSGASGTPFRGSPLPQAWPPRGAPRGLRAMCTAGRVPHTAGAQGSAVQTPPGALAPSKLGLESWGSVLSQTPSQARLTAQISCYEWNVPSAPSRADKSPGRKGTGRLLDRTAAQVATVTDGAGGRCDCPTRSCLSGRPPRPPLPGSPARGVGVGGQSTDSPPAGASAAGACQPVKVSPCGLCPEIKADSPEEPGDLRPR